MDEQFYKEMYIKMVAASEKAINTLIQAQKECEEIYLAHTSTSDLNRFYNKWWGSEAERLSYTQHLLLLGKKSRA